jgi:hypothetical protein
MKKQLIVIGTAVLLLVVGLCGCVEQSKQDGQDELDGVKTIDISGIEVVQTITYTEKPVRLIISGIDCDITVSKETELKEIEISGIDCIIRVSRSHSYTLDNNGINCEVIFYD